MGTEVVGRQSACGGVERRSKESPLTTDTRRAQKDTVGSVSIRQLPLLLRPSSRAPTQNVQQDR